MSGRKYSEVELANNVREALRCQVAAQRGTTSGREPGNRVK